MTIPTKVDPAPSVEQIPAWMNQEAIDTLSRGYFLPGETPRGMWTRVTKAAARILDRPDMEGDFFEMFWRGYVGGATPVLSNMGSNRGLPISCYSTHISDSIHSIYSHLKEVAALSKHGGGVGVYFGDIRSAGSHITGGGKSTGVVPWARQYDYASQVVSQGGVRRGSFALYVPIDHPDLPELLRSKDHAMGDPRNFIDSQIAVTIEDKWVEEMIAGDREKQKLFGEVLKMRLVSGSPYMIFIDNANNQRPSSFAQRNLNIYTSNLCFTGETLVAVADGRNPVPIKDLVDTQFPVYSARKAIYKGGWVTEIKPATAFPTGVREVVEVELEDGSTFRCTPDHLLATRSCDWVEAEDSVGKVIEPFTRFNNEFGHNMVNSVSNGRRRQSRMVWEYYNGDPGKGFQVDHIESQGGDNLNNLQLLTREEHLHKTSSERMGDNNPIHKVDSQFHSEYTSAAVTGKKNPRFNGIDNYQLIALGRMVYEEEGTFSKKQYLGLIEKGYNVPRSFSSYRFGNSFAEYTEYVVGNKEYNGEYEIEKEPPSNPRTVANETIKAKVKAIRNNGLKVVSIRPAGVETVYDLRVEDNHNFFIVTSQGEIESGVLVHNCSEIFLPTDENHTFVCVLSSLNLAKWDEWKNWVGPNTGKTVPELMVYFLDAVVDEFISKAERLPSMGRAVRFARKSRALGLGTMGLHALYQEHHLPFKSEQARKLNLDIHKQIDILTLKASRAMAVEYGEPEWCQGDGIRHATRIAIAPTKSNSVICGAVSQGIEPIDSNYYVAKQAKGSFVRKNPYLEAHLKTIGYNTSEVWDSILDARGSVQHLHSILDDDSLEVFKTAREIDQFEIIRQASDRQPHVCQGQSVNLFVDPEASAAYLVRLHLSAWKAKLKSLYYLKSSSLLVKQSKAKIAPTFTPVMESASAVIYSKPGCPYCDKAKLVLDLHGYAREEYHPDEWSNGKFPYKTVPQIWIGGEHIGGYDDLMVWLEGNPADTTPWLNVPPIGKVYEECESCQG